MVVALTCMKVLTEHECGGVDGVHICAYIFVPNPDRWLVGFGTGKHLLGGHSE